MRACAPFALSRCLTSSRTIPHHHPSPLPLTRPGAFWVSGEDGCALAGVLRNRSCRGKNRRECVKTHAGSQARARPHSRAAHTARTRRRRPREARRARIRAHRAREEEDEDEEDGGGHDHDDGPARELVPLTKSCCHEYCTFSALTPAHVHARALTFR